MFECPVCIPPYVRTEQGKINSHVLANRQDPAHALEAEKLLNCICGNRFTTPQGLSKHTPTCSVANPIKNLKSGFTPATVSAEPKNKEIAHSRPAIRTPMGNPPQSSLLTRSTSKRVDIAFICCSVSHSLSPPQDLLVSENLFRNIRVYFEDSCRNIDNYGTVRAPDGTELLYDMCNDFDSYCFTATKLITKGLYVDSRRALYKATALVKPILRLEHPRSLACFLEVLIHLIQTNLPEVASLLRDFIKEISVEVIARGHPWGEICRLLGELDSRFLEQAMAEIWKCSTDIFGHKLGTLNPFAVYVRLDYLKRVYGCTEYLWEEEQHIRALLAQSEGNPQRWTTRAMLNLAHNLNRRSCPCEAEEMALEVFRLLPEDERYTGMIVDTIESLKIISRSQLYLGKTQEAELTMREAILVIVRKWGKQHPWVLEFKNDLEVWLRDWGREGDANILRQEIEELMGKDDE